MQSLFDDDPKPATKKRSNGKLVAVIAVVLGLGYFLLKALKVL